jgi:hypothetical protein
MRDNSFNKSFLNNFRPGDEILPFAEERQYKGLFFRQYKGSKKEIPFLGESLIYKIDEADISRKIISKIEKEDIPVLQQISGFVYGFRQIIQSFAGREPFCSGYYQKLQFLLNPFYSVISSYKENTLKKVKHTLIHTDAQTIYRQSTATCHEMEEFSKRLRKYYDRFDFLLRGQTPGCSNVATVSRMEQYQRQLVTLLEKALVITHSTELLMKKTNDPLSDLELQELYN